jgi:2-polyprenyl-6-methoxyphenol hydroxylase-like FAD-dependent oxidoreductase
LHEVLLDGASGVPIRWGTTVTAIDRSVSFDDGTSERYDLVVGADGIRSSVRNLLFGQAPPRPVGQYARRFVVHLPAFAFPAGEPVWSVLISRGAVFLSLPIGGGDLYCYCDGPAVKPGQQPQPLRQLLAGFGEPVPTLLRALEAAGDVPQSGAIEEVVLESWSRGNAVLVGDAAHATSPNLAEGAAMAVEDAIVLAESLTDEPTTSAALHRFEARRRPRTDWVLDRTHDRDRTRALPNVVRNFVLRRTGQKLYRAHYKLLRTPV